MQKLVIWALAKCGLEFCQGCGTLVNTRPVPTDLDGINRVKHDEAVCFGVRRRDLARHRVAIDNATAKAKEATELVADHENDILAAAALNRDQDRQLAGLTREYSALKDRLHRWVGFVYKPEPEDDRMPMKTLLLNQTIDGQQDFVLPLSCIKRLTEQAGVTLVVQPLGATTMGQDLPLPTSVSIEAN